MPLPTAFLNHPIAHRALHGPGRPENSREAIGAAIAAGYGIEIDIQPSLDGAAMVFHDYDMGRLTSHKGPIAQQPAADLAGMTLTGGPTGIPTLTEVLDQVAGQVPLLIEVKDQDGRMGPKVGPLEQAVGRALQGYAGDAALMSFNPHSVAALKAAAPNRPLGLTTCGYAAEHWPLIPEARRAALREIPDADPLGIDFISHGWRDLGDAAVQRLKDQGCAILCWTIRSAQEETTARRIAQNITFEGYTPA